MLNYFLAIFISLNLYATQISTFEIMPQALNPKRKPNYKQFYKRYKRNKQQFLAQQPAWLLVKKLAAVNEDNCRINFLDSGFFFPNNIKPRKPRCLSSSERDALIKHRRELPKIIKEHMDLIIEGRTELIKRASLFLLWSQKAKQEELSNKEIQTYIATLANLGNVKCQKYILHKMRKFNRYKLTQIFVDWLDLKISLGWRPVQAYVVNLFYEHSNLESLKEAAFKNWPEARALYCKNLANKGKEKGLFKLADVEDWPEAQAEYVRYVSGSEHPIETHHVLAKKFMLYFKFKKAIRDTKNNKKRITIGGTNK